MSIPVETPIAAATARRVSPPNPLSASPCHTASDTSSRRASRSPGAGAMLLPYVPNSCYVPGMRHPMLTLPLGDNARLRALEPWQAPEFLAHIDRARPSVDPWIPWAARSTDLDS